MEAEGWTSGGGGVSRPGRVVETEGSEVRGERRSGWMGVAGGGSIEAGGGMEMGLGAGSGGGGEGRRGLLVVADGLVVAEGLPRGREGSRSRSWGFLGGRSFLRSTILSERAARLGLAGETTGSVFTVSGGCQCDRSWAGLL